MQLNTTETSKILRSDHRSRLKVFKWNVFFVGRCYRQITCAVGVNERDFGIPAKIARKPKPHARTWTSIGLCAIRTAHLLWDECRWEIRSKQNSWWVKYVSLLSLPTTVTAQSPPLQIRPPLMPDLTATTLRRRQPGGGWCGVVTTRRSWGRCAPVGATKMRWAYPRCHLAR